MATECDCLNGYIKQYASMVANGRKERFYVISHPCQEFGYAKNKIIYNLLQISDESVAPIILVRGYRKDNIHLHEGFRCTEIEPVKESERKNLERIVRNVVKKDWKVEFANE